MAIDPKIMVGFGPSEEATARIIAERREFYKGIYDFDDDCRLVIPEEGMSALSKILCECVQECLFATIPDDKVPSIEAVINNKLSDGSKFSKYFIKSMRGVDCVDLFDECFGIYKKHDSDIEPVLASGSPERLMQYVYNKINTPSTLILSGNPNDFFFFRNRDAFGSCHSYPSSYPMYYMYDKKVLVLYSTDKDRTKMLGRSWVFSFTKGIESNMITGLLVPSLRYGFIQEQQVTSYFKNVATEKLHLKETDYPSNKFIVNTAAYFDSKMCVSFGSGHFESNNCSCPICGRRKKVASHLLCDECYGVLEVRSCSTCGNFVTKDMIKKSADFSGCTHCYEIYKKNLTPCHCCGKEIDKRSSLRVKGVYVCNHCYDKLPRCLLCKDVYLHDNITTVFDKWHICPVCNADDSKIVCETCGKPTHKLFVSEGDHPVCISCAALDIYGIPLSELEVFVNV